MAQEEDLRILTQVFEVSVIFSANVVLMGIMSKE